ncbi:MAG: hypothetical protein D6770_03880 [Anaerolineae bacterium]|nr:MAG: hypothetical protein D6770_03880 [Anaerolineae bacterium]
MPFEINWTPIIIGIVAFFVGYLFAMLDQRVTASMRSPKEAKKDKGEETVRVKVVERVVPEPAALRVVEKDTGVQIFLDGAAVEPSTITELQKKRLIALLTHFRPLVGGKPTTSPPPPPRPEPSPTSPPTATDVVATASKEVTKPSSIIEQIDDILQAKLARSPLAGRGIRLVEAPDGSVHIWVAQNLYKAIDEIPDPAIQAIIREAIAEWERRSTPGSQA